VKVAIVVPEPPIRQALARALAGGEYVIDWTAGTGAEALHQFESGDADVLLVGATLADMSPADLTRRLLARRSCGVIVLAHDTSEGVSKVYDAMAAGALDVLRVQALGERISSEALLAKVRTASRMLGHTSGKMRSIQAGAVMASARPPALIAIGASTGGPQALLTVLSGLPRNVSASIVIVQHVDSEFSEGLATWLQEGSGVRLEIARVGSAPKAGVALLASSKDHLIMTAGGSFRYTPEPRALAYRPSVDVLFQSLTQHWKTPGAAVLLTGMGRDGADGLHKLRKSGWHTIAQEESSCVVYGMPKAAVLLGAASKVLDPPAIAAELAAFVARRQARHV
jgi:two-component system, chemotaxis family, response regulator WspF